MSYLSIEQVQAEWRRLGLHRGWSLHEAMQHALQARPQALIAFHAPDTGVSTYRLDELHRRAEGLAAGLSRLGIGPGETLAVQLPNAVESAMIHIAAARLGCVLLPIVHIFGPKELTYVLRDSGAKTLILSSAWRRGQAEQKLAELDAPALERVILIGPEIEGVDAVSFDALCESGEPLPPPAVCDPNDTALMLYTSGTTSAPKGVLHSHNSLLAEFFSMRIEQGDGDAVRLSPWPPGHIAGTIGLLGHSVLGRDAVIMQQWDASAAAELIEQFQVAETSGTPLHLLGIIEAATAQGRDLKSLRRFLTGATTVPETVIARAEALGVRACRCYGSTELPTSTACKAEDPLEKRLSTDGRPLPGCEIRIVDDDLNNVPVGKDGEILVRGAELARKYSDPERTAESFLPDGWFRTGDIGRLDLEGYMTVTDRKKDIIIRGGENISSLEIEDLLLQMPGVREAAAVAAPDERLGEIVCAFVVPEPGAAPDIPTIDRHFRQMGVARQKTPERLEIVEALPRTPAGKVMKTELRAQLKAQAGRSLPAGQ